MPPFVKDLLKAGDNPVEFEEATFINDIKRHNVKIYECEIDSNIIFNKYWANKQKGISNKILIVCNTVKKAQQIYVELMDKGITCVNILHSKFIKCERSEKEKEILAFGRNEKSGEGIWVCTQIVEASLDIDFDYEFTELSDLSGLFQRLGRCNRKGIKPIDEPNCFVFLNIDNNLLTNGTKGFIDRKLYALSKEAMLNKTGILSENDKINIINQYLTTENLKGSDYLRKYHEFAEWIKNLYPYEIDKSEINLRNIVSYDVIPYEVYLKHKDEIDSNSTELLRVINSKLDKNELEIVKLTKLKKKEEIKKYTVPVGRYDIYFEWGNTIVGKVQLGKNEFINVVNCQYNKLGFIRLNIKDVRGMKENFDNFL